MESKHWPWSNFTSGSFFNHILSSFFCIIFSSTVRRLNWGPSNVSPAQCSDHSLAPPKFYFWTCFVKLSLFSFGIKSWFLFIYLFFYFIYFFKKHLLISRLLLDTDSGWLTGKPVSPVGFPINQTGWERPGVQRQSAAGRVSKEWELSCSWKQGKAVTWYDCDKCYW